MSCVKSVESVLEDYKIIKTQPLYRAIIRSIRQKIVEEADTALVAYNIPDEDWVAIKKCLSLHYADKRDIRTLEYQLYALYQGKRTIDEFFGEVNHHLTLIINKVQTECLSYVTAASIIEGHRNRALDTFIRGLNGELSKLIAIKSPKSLPEAYSSCLELQNINYRATNFLNRNNQTNPVAVPHNALAPPIVPPRRSLFTPTPQPRTVFHPPQLTQQQKNLIYNTQNRSFAQTNQIPQGGPNNRAEPMEIDRSIQTRQVNYMNRPPIQARPQQYHRQFQQYSPPPKRPIQGNNMQTNQPSKIQRLYHNETEDLEEQYEEKVDELYEEQYDDEDIFADQEINFLMVGSVRHPT